MISLESVSHSRSKNMCIISVRSGLTEFWMRVFDTDKDR